MIHVRSRLTPNTFACIGAAALALSACTTHYPRRAPAANAATAAPAALAADPAAATGAKLRAALAGPHRSPENVARDKYRHPYETLMFFGLRDNMTVVELYPGGGWYTEVLAPVLKDNGKLYVTSTDPNGPADDYNTKRAQEMLALKAKHPDTFGKVEMAIIDPNGELSFGPPGSADMVVSFRSIHGWFGGGSIDKQIRAVAAVLKPGGVFGIEGHRGNPGTKPGEGGYVAQEDAIKAIEAAGLKLAETSEVNANPKDTKDHPEGVWALPPTLRHGDTDREKYTAIGESDRFTLRFVKP